VDDTPLDVQIKLLRVLQERSFERVGGERPVRVNLRIVAATKKSLAALAAANQFRQDLYYRLSVVPIRLPPLREHLEDIPLLVEYLLERLSVRLNRGQITIAPAAIGRLREHAWPGNVRELEHVLEQMAAVSRTGALDLEDVPPFQPDSRPASLVSVDLERADAVDLAAVLAAVEERLLRWALDRAKGNLAQAATLLGIPRSTLQYKLSKQAPTAP
jgi:DNA-binding NtrC family response regulator